MKKPKLNLSQKIDQSTPRPLYQHVKDFITKQIRSNRWGKNTKIPSENELVTSLGVSRMTINRALSELTKEGYLTRLQGVGTFVAQRKPLSALLEIKSIAEEIRGIGGIHHCKVHLLREETVSQDLAVTMNLPLNTLVFHSILVHYDKDIAIQIEDRFVNPAVAADYLNQDFSKITPSEYLTGIAPATDVEHIIEAILPDKQAQTLLGIHAHEPCLVLYRRTWVNDLSVSNNRFIYPGTRYRIGGRFRPAAIEQRP